MRQREASLLVTDVPSDESLRDALEYRFPCAAGFMTNLKVEVRKDMKRDVVKLDQVRNRRKDR